GVPDDPDRHAGEPQPQAQTQGGGQGAVDDGERARRAGQEDRLHQGPMKGRDEILGDRVSHQTSAPPPKGKKLRKKELAAKAMEGPKTIWSSRRAPPDVSPKARVRPVTMMIITAMILATGPSIDSRMDWSGASQGMEEPPARAGEAQTAASASRTAGWRRR